MKPGDQRDEAVGLVCDRRQRSLWRQTREADLLHGKHAIFAQHAENGDDRASDENMVLQYCPRQSDAAGIIFERDHIVVATILVDRSIDDCIRALECIAKHLVKNIGLALHVLVHSTNHDNLRTGISIERLHEARSSHRCIMTTICGVRMHCAPLCLCGALRAWSKRCEASEVQIGELILARQLFHSQLLRLVAVLVARARAHEHPRRRRHHSAHRTTLRGEMSALYNTSQCSNMRNVSITFSRAAFALCSALRRAANLGRPQPYSSRYSIGIPVCIPYPATYSHRAMPCRGLQAARQHPARRGTAPYAHLSIVSTLPDLRRRRT
eukprot:6174598-Pleurochrysis_carterae.AAC.4